MPASPGLWGEVDVRAADVNADHKVAVLRDLAGLKSRLRGIRSPGPVPREPGAATPSDPSETRCRCVDLNFQVVGGHHGTVVQADAQGQIGA